MTEQETQITQLTKPKSKGRVEAGKKLAEWNRVNKQKLKQELGTTTSQELGTTTSQELATSSSQELTSTSSGVKSSHILVFFAGIGAFFGLAYVLKNRVKETAKAEPKAEAVFDQFKS